MDTRSRIDPTAARQPDGRSVGHTDSTAKSAVPMPHNVMTTTRKRPRGAVTAYMSLIEYFRAL